MAVGLLDLLGGFWRPCLSLLPTQCQENERFLVQVLPQSLLSPLLSSTPLLVAPRLCLRAPVSR